VKRPHAAPKRRSTKLDYCERCRLWHDPRESCISVSSQWAITMERLQDRRENRLREPPHFDSRFLRANPTYSRGPKR
jgi:hypothetical protein